jgi:hypothetical protein
MWAWGHNGMRKNSHPFKNGTSIYVFKKKLSSYLRILLKFIPYLGTAFFDGFAFPPISVHFIGPA